MWKLIHRDWRSLILQITLKLLDLTSHWVSELQSVQFSRSVMSDSFQPHGLQHARFPCPSPTSGGLLKLMSIKLVIPSNRLILCHPLLLLPSIFPIIRVFSSESVLHIRWPKYWSFSFRISPSNEYSVLISFRMTGLISLLSKGLIFVCLFVLSFLISIFYSLAK